MSTASDVIAGDAVAMLVSGLVERGYALARDVLPEAVIAGLRRRALASDEAGALRQAGVGHGDGRDDRADIRGDRILWLNEQPHDAAERAAFALFDALREQCNRELLGLVAFEAHYALYPPGAFYARHRDRFRDDDTRVLSCVLYLNDDWRAEQGGVLRLHVDGAAPLDVLPVGGTLVAFLSDTFDHEVLPATRTRLALTGWFRRRAL